MSVTQLMFSSLRRDNHHKIYDAMITRLRYSTTTLDHATKLFFLEH